MKKVILIGDSISMGYRGCVQSELIGIATCWGPAENGGTSRNVLAHLDDWVLTRPADVIHLNCGLHDLKREFGAPETAVPLAEYEQNVRLIFQRIREHSTARLIWATTTPVNEAWHHRVKAFDRCEADVAAYNAAALGVATELGVAVDDLFAVVEQAGRDKLLLEDGVHFKPDGYVLLGAAVSRSVRAAL
ncbi:MAG TPA: GDSL-type esterase/lipase family protein [Abditibacteriaceae bacterium]|nr:GDSL-type esterase/lipase family protein [Abditibacteriaceae bacterium]